MKTDRTPTPTLSQSDMTIDLCSSSSTPLPPQLPARKAFALLNQHQIRTGPGYGDSCIVRLSGSDQPLQSKSNENVQAASPPAAGKLLNVTELPPELTVSEVYDVFVKFGGCDCNRVPHCHFACPLPSHSGRQGPPVSRNPQARSTPASCPYPVPARSTSTTQPTPTRVRRR